MLIKDLITQLQDFQERMEAMGISQPEVLIRDTHYGKNSEIEDIFTVSTRYAAKHKETVLIIRPF